MEESGPAPPGTFELKLLSAGEPPYPDLPPTPLWELSVGPLVRRSDGEYL